MSLLWRACDHNMPHSTTSSMGECYSTSSSEHATSYYSDNAACIQCFNSNSLTRDQPGTSYQGTSAASSRSTPRPTQVYQVQSITGRALSRHDVRLITEPITLRIGNLHEEDIKLLVLEEANTDIILGRPWFVLREPQISWRTGDVLKWGYQCFPDCFPNLPRPSMPVSQTLFLNSTSIKSPIEKQSVEIPECYAHFSDVFCPTKASQLPPHRPWDCAIDLLPG